MKTILFGTLALAALSFGSAAADMPEGCKCNPCHCDSCACGPAKTDRCACRPCECDPCSCGAKKHRRAR